MTWTLAGRYRLTSAVASGATGEIWRATDHGTGLPVAVKLLHPDLAADDRVVDQLLRARRTLTALWHPGIARLLDVVVTDRTDRTVGLVSDFVPGSDLARLLASAGPLAPAPAARVAAAMAEALDSAHRAGLVHGDVKPSNVMIANGVPPPGSLLGSPPEPPLADAVAVRLTDFSVAALVRTGRPGTAGGGSSPYSAPWVIDGTVPTPSSDVHALGIVLFEMLTGATSPAAVTAPEVDRDLLEVIDRCVLGDQSARPSAGTLSKRLRDLAAQLPETAAPPARASAPAPAPARTGPSRTTRSRPSRTTRAGPSPTTRAGPAHTRAPTPGGRRGLVRLAVGSAAAAAVVAGAIVAVNALTAPSPTDPPPGAATSATATVGAPTLPADAGDQTQEGGTEFVHYWFAALTYALQTGDTAGLVEATSPECPDCQRVIGVIEQTYAGGGELRGGGYLVRGVSTASLWSAGRPVYDATVDRAPRTEVDAAGATRSTVPPLSFGNCVLVLEWTDQRWQVRDVLSSDCIA